MTIYQQLLEAIKKTNAICNEHDYFARRIQMKQDNLNKIDDIDLLSLSAIERVFEYYEYLKNELYDIVDKNNFDELNQDIKNDFLDQLREIVMNGEETYFHIDSLLNNSTSLKNYEYLKRSAKKAKQLLLDMPNDIIENTFNCKVKFFDQGDKFNSQAMKKITTMGHIQIDNPREISNPDKDLGNFVYECILPAVIDKENNEILLKADVTAYLVELSPRLSKFRFIK